MGERILVRPLSGPCCVKKRRFIILIMNQTEEFFYVWNVPVTDRRTIRQAALTRRQVVAE